MLQEKAMATHSSTLAGKIPGRGEPGGCRLWGRTESDTTEATLQQQHVLHLHTLKTSSDNAIIFVFNHRTHVKNSKGE